MGGLSFPASVPTPARGQECWAGQCQEPLQLPVLSQHLVPSLSLPKAVLSSQVSYVSFRAEKSTRGTKDAQGVSLPRALGSLRLWPPLAGPEVVSAPCYPLSFLSLVLPRLHWEWPLQLLLSQEQMHREGRRAGKCESHPLGGEDWSLDRTFPATSLLEASSSLLTSKAHELPASLGDVPQYPEICSKCPPEPSGSGDTRTALSCVWSWH